MGIFLKYKFNGEDFKCKNVRGPTPGITKNPCDDCATDSVFIFKNIDNEKIQGNCRLLSHQLTKAKLCGNNDIIREACIDTCRDKYD